MEYYIYRLLRTSDGKQYIGTTDQNNFSGRMACHRRSARYRGTSFSIEILLTGPTTDVLVQEGAFIEKYDTLHPNGLNLTKSGKGCGHNSPEFTTRGYKYSAASRKKMSNSAKERCRRQPRVGWHHSSDYKTRMSEMRKGKPALHKRKLTEEQEATLRDLYLSKPALADVGVPHMSNGIVLTYDRAFVLRYAKIFGLTPNGLRGILRRVCP